MTDLDDFAGVRLEAERLLKELDITEFPVNPYEIAKRLDIELHPMPANSGGASGMLIRFGNEFGIGYPTHINNEGFKRFSVGHELGHYRLPGHPEAVIDAKGKHLSRAGFVTSDRYELEADHFSAALLMPRRQFTEALSKLPVGLRCIEPLKTLCITSIEATAIRYTQCNSNPVAVIRSNGNRIDYAFMSDALRDFHGLTWIKKNTPVPPETETAEFVRDTSQISNGGRVVGKSDLSDWFGGRSQQIGEEVLGLGQYGKVITVLTGMENPDETEDDEADMTDSWTPKFRR